MRCTNCSMELKPIVALDIDGTLGDYHGHFINFMDAYLGTAESPASYDGTTSFSNWCMALKGITLEQYRDIKLAYRQGAQKRSMPIFDGARALCWSIRDRGGELWLTTTRPYLSLDGVIKDTVFWLDHYEIEYDGLLYDDDKYKVLAERVDPARVVAVLDDQYDMYDAAEEAFGMHVPILVRGHYNRAVRRVMMCDLDSAADIIRHRIQGWELAHA